MKRIIEIGMDVHTTNFTLCIYEPSLNGEGKVLFQTQVMPETKNIIKVIDNFKKKNPDDELDITCGYEAGCLGYSLYHDLFKNGIKCIILAPTTMKVERCKRKVKNDKRDAKMIAEALAYGAYSSVYVPTDKDNAIKEFIRMRDDIKTNFKRIKQQILSLLTRNGHHYSETSYWTTKHLNWLKDLKFENEIIKETFDEYMIEYRHLESRIEKLDQRIEEFAMKDEYKESVDKLKCFIGIKTHTALSLIVETSDFKRFNRGDLYSSYLGLTPGEDSSGEDINRLSITKAGNRHIRKLLVEAAQAYTRGAIGHISKDLKTRQSLCSTDIVAYANKANERLRRRFYRLVSRGKKHNVAKVAIARELASFIWGMMTDNIAL